MSTADEVNSFLLAFEKLRLCSDGDPHALAADVLNDNSMGELCIELTTLHTKLMGGLPAIRPGQRTGLHSQHIARLREYADRWERSVDLAMFAWFAKRNQEFRDRGDLDPEISEVFAAIDRAGEALSNDYSSLSDDIWSHLDKIGKQNLSDIDEELEITGALKDDGSYQSAIGRFFSTANGLGWKIDGIFRRAGLLPEILIPSHLSNKLQIGRAHV